VAIPPLGTPSATPKRRTSRRISGNYHVNVVGARCGGTPWAGWRLR
jgi:hypothetical protein